MKFYKRFPGDIGIKTGHLTPAEFGCYDRLLDHYYATETPIPDGRAHGICRALTKQDRDACDKVLGEFFELNTEGWVQQRAEEVIAEALPKIEAARENGKKGGRPLGSGKKPTGLIPETKDATETVDSEKASQSQSSSPSSKKVSKPSASHPPAGGLPPGFLEFWQAWPKNDRKQDKGKCAEVWKAKKLHELADTILADVRAKRGTEKWAEGYIEAPLVYLRNRRWEDHNTDAPDEDLGDWRATRMSVEAKGVALGLGKWDQTAFESGRGGEMFSQYEKRVADRVAQLEGVPA